MFEKTFSFWRRLIGKEPAQATATTETQDDRRLWVRYEADLQGTVQADQTARFLAKVRDLSLGGANLIVTRPVELGQMLTVDLPVSDKETFTILACVVRSHPQSNGHWSLGCVFARELTEDDLDRFGARKVQASADDQRNWVRFACALTAHYRKVGDASNQSHAAQILNISPNGIGLAVNPSLAAGTLLNVDLLDKTGRTVRTILACVVHATLRQGGDYAVGCNFIRELSEEELHSML